VTGRRNSARRSYDAVAEKYADGFRDELAGKPLDRALLACLIEQAGQRAPIANVGCGAAGSIERSRSREGNLLDLPTRDGEFGAVIALYSIIHLGPGELDRAFVAAMERTGFLAQARLERMNYPGEAEPRCGYVLARRPAQVLPGPGFQSTP
jgi:hypothetical protein